jgi:cytochrome P450
LTTTQVSSREAEDVVVRLFKTSEGRRDPYPLYHRLRELAPVHRSDEVHVWLLSRYEDGAAALRDPRLGKDYVRTMDVRRANWRERPSMTSGERSMLNTDGPYHTRLRKLVSKAFTPRNVEALRPRIEAMVDAYLDRLAASGGGDLMSVIAFPLPVQVIGELLGVPEADRPQFRELVRDVTAVFEVGATDEQLDRADAASLETDDYFRSLIEDKRKHPDDALLSRLLAASDGGDRLTDDELVTLANLLFAAGFETTTNLIGNGMVALFRHPDQMGVLRAGPGAAPELSDELLRYDGTAQMSTRFVKEDVVFGGQTIPAGDTVFTLLGAGNHDPARFAEPDRLDLTRTSIRPLSFGGGVHFCIGAALARLEIEVFFNKMFGRFATIELEGAEPEFRDRLTLRGVSELNVTVREGAAATPTAVAPSQLSQPPRAVEPEAFELDAILPPRPGGEADRAWRAAFRRQIEDHGRHGAELPAMIALLRRVPLFRGCTSADLETLARGAFMIGFEHGDQLCVEGAEAPECYVIAEGEADCTIDGRLVATVGMDDVVGELGPLLGRPRAATVTATTHMVTYAISREELERLAEASPQAASAMRSEIERKYRERP